VDSTFNTVSFFLFNPDRCPSLNSVFLSSGTPSGLDFLRFWTGMGSHYNHPTINNNFFTCSTIISGYLTESIHLKIRKSSHKGSQRNNRFIERLFFYPRPARRWAGWIFEPLIIIWLWYNKKIRNL